MKSHFKALCIALYYMVMVINQYVLSAHSLVLDQVSLRGSGNETHLGLSVSF